LCTSGTIIRPNSIETRKPIARYMIGSIIGGNSHGKETVNHNAMGHTVNASLMAR
jgi:hypothetical protein